MGETQRNRWLLAMQACADINSAMQELTDTTFVTSGQHKDTSMLDRQGTIKTASPGLVSSNIAILSRQARR